MTISSSLSRPATNDYGRIRRRRAAKKSLLRVPKTRPHGNDRGAADTVSDAQRAALNKVLTDIESIAQEVAAKPSKADDRARLIHSRTARRGPA